MPTYDDHFFNPSGPLVRVTLRNSEDGKTVSDVLMLIDSGADVTLRRACRRRFLVSSQEWGIVGRDVLNHVSVLLDGPQLVWDEQKSSDR